MSLVTVAPRRAGGLDPLLEALARQTLADRLELVVVAEREREGGARLEKAGSALRTKLVPVDAIESRAAAYAAGAREARAPLVALLEDHARPDPEWAEVVAEAHRGPWAVVGAVIANANPESAASRASFLVAFGRWARSREAGEVEALPWLNVCYKREVLGGEPERLERSLAERTEFVRGLTSTGHRALLTGATTLRHTNPSRLWTMLRMRFLSGRLSAAWKARRRRWGRTRRALHAIGTPLVPAIRFARSVPWLVGRDRVHPADPMTLLALGAALVADAAGRALGYAAGPGDAPRRYAELHLDPAGEPGREAPGPEEREALLRAPG